MFAFHFFLQKLVLFCRYKWIHELILIERFFLIFLYECQFQKSNLPISIVNRSPLRCTFWFRWCPLLPATGLPAYSFFVQQIRTMAVTGIAMTPTKMTKKYVPPLPNKLSSSTMSLSSGMGCGYSGTWVGSSQGVRVVPSSLVVTPQFAACDRHPEMN